MNELEAKRRDAADAELLDAFWAGLAEDLDAPAPADLDEELGALSRRLHADARHDAPSRAFVASLGSSFIAEPRRVQAAPKRRVSRWLMVGASAAAAMLIAVGIGVALNRGTETASAEEILLASQTTAQSLNAAGIESFVLETESTALLPSRIPGQSGNASVRENTIHWYAGPDRERRESESTALLANGEPAGASSWFVLREGGSVWEARSEPAVVDVNADDGGWAITPSALPSGIESLSIDAVVSSLAECFRPEVKGTTELAGRDAYVLDLGKTRCPSASMPAELQGHEVWYVDTKTYLVLGREQYGADGALVAQTRTVRIEYDVAIDPRVFEFTPPPGATVIDHRPKGAPSILQFVEQVEAIAAQAPFTVFMPEMPLSSLVPRAPKYPDAGGAVVIEYVPASEADRDTPAGDRGISITQQPATADVVSAWRQGASVVDVGGTPGWLRIGGTGVDSAVLVVRDGTLISVNSFYFEKDVLLLVAASLRPALD